MPVHTMRICGKMKMIGFECAWRNCMEFAHSLSRGLRRKLPGRILLELMLWHVAFDGDCLVGHPVQVSLLADCISWCLHAGCHLLSSSTEALLLMGSERTQSDSSSDTTWSSQRRKSHSGMNSLSQNGEQEQKGGEAKGKTTEQMMLHGKSGLAVP